MTTNKAVDVRRTSVRRSDVSFSSKSSREVVHSPDPSFHCPSQITGCHRTKVTVKPKWMVPVVDKFVRRVTGRCPRIIKRS